METKQNKKERYDKPIEIEEGIHWVGFYDEGANFYCNPYLLVEKDRAILIDPGSIPHFPIVGRKVFSIVEPKKISSIILQHQDPDLCAAVPLFEDLIKNQDLKIITTERAGFLIKHYGIKSRFVYIDKTLKFFLSPQRTLVFIPTPYLHTPGAFITYDTKSKILFSSDIFGAFSEKWDLYAGKSYPSQMKKFMEPYMPSYEFLKPVLDRLEAMEIKMIAPQHGSVIKGKDVKEILAFARKLKYGGYFKKYYG